MGRKVVLAYIARASARRAAYKKRKNCLLKKIHELTTLCGIDACLVIYSEFETRPDCPVVWPNWERAQSLVDQFRGMSEIDRKWRMYDQPAYIRQQIEKAKQNLMRRQRDGKWRKVAITLLRCLNGELAVEEGTNEERSQLGCLIDLRLKEISRRLQYLEQQPQQLLMLLPPEPEQQLLMLPPPEQQQFQPVLMLPPPEPEQQQLQPLLMLPPPDPEQQQLQPLLMLPPPEPMGIPGVPLGPMVRLLLGIDSDDAESDILAAGQCNQQHPLLMLPPPEPKQQQQQLLMLPPSEQQQLPMLPPPEPMGIPGVPLGPMVRLLLGIDSDDAELDTWPEGGVRWC